MRAVPVDSERTPEQRFAAENSDTMVPRLLLQGVSEELVVAKLVRLDWSPASARALVTRVADDLRRYHESPESRARLVQEAWGQVVTGLSLAALGAVIGVGFTLLAAGFGVLSIGAAFGPMLLGLTLLARNWGRWRLYRQHPLPFPGGEGRTRPRPEAFTDRKG